jgi:hypothetical protein
MKTEMAKDLLIGEIASQYGISAYDEEFIVTTPFTFEDGTIIEVRATFIDGLVTVSDDGYVAQELEQMGLDVTPRRKSNASKNWDSIRKHLPFAPAMGAYDWEIAVTAEIEHFGTAVTAVAEAALRGEALKVLAPAYTPVSFSEKVIQFLSSYRESLRIQPKVAIPQVGGGTREVSFTATVENKLYVQSAALENRNAAYDKAVGVFNATSIDRSKRLVALEGHIDEWEPWHIDGIQKVSRFEEAYDLERFADSIVRLAA